MVSHVKKSLFLYVPDTEYLIKQVVGTSLDCQIFTVPLQKFIDNPGQHLPLANHVVVSAPLGAIKSVIELALEHNFSMGIIPTPDQKNLGTCYGLPKKINEALELALHQNAQPLDLLFCNNNILVFKATVGRLPLIDSSSNTHGVKAILFALRHFIGLKLLPFRFRTGSGKKIETAVSGCMILKHHERTLASKLISHDSSLTDGMISLLITAPISILDYFSFLYQAFRCTGKRKRIPSTIAYIKSNTITIETETPLDVSIDDESVTQTPLHCTIIPQAVRINVGQGLLESPAQSKSSNERLEIHNLPTGKEVNKAANQRIPFFSYASEERFRDLFISLREDARIHPTYLVLMVLSTMLAAVGLYQSSSAVVIGAMLLAPLMAPIVSLAMGLLRYDTRLSRTSILTILMGIVIALSAAGLISLLFPHKPITMEMQARLNPSLFDLAVAIVAGIAGAYTKSHKEILQSLAGVSVAVALVPPLAVAGIGLGMGDFHFFSQAFLLFSTNLIGITFAATLTFRMLGYSPVVRNKKGFAFIAILLGCITIPLYLSYHNLVTTALLEKNWKHERFLINDKYLIVQNAKLVQQREQDLLFVRVLVREPLTRMDLNQMRKRIESNFTGDLDIRLEVMYIP